ncbi:MAG: restriction endonuclease [Verrucomicrobiota bacterium]|nr:restriction endonuclease [Verrucomicrobiota bacterium]
MAVEYFSWASMQLAELETRLSALLDVAHRNFLESVANEGADFEDRISTSTYLRELAQRVKDWCEHFEVPVGGIRPYDRSLRPHFGRSCSWNLSLDLGQISADILRGLTGPTTNAGKLYRPKILERANAEVMNWLKKTPKDIDRVHWRSFEAIIAEVLKDKGWSIEITKQTRDGGYDILGIRNDALGFSETILVECKLYGIGRSVGVPMVDRLMGVMRRQTADQAMLVTNSRFTGVVWQSWERSVGRELSLIDRESLSEWLASYGATHNQPQSNG